jgi:hypothetical protein
MFNLVVAVISIALIAVMAVAGLWYGGSTFTAQTQKTEYATMANAASQIKGAMEIYRAKNGMYPTGVADEGAGITVTDDMLSSLAAESYLSGVPEGEWIIGSGYIQRTIEDEAACARANMFAGFTEECPACDDPTRVDYPACATAE